MASVPVRPVAVAPETANEEVPAVVGLAQSVPVVVLSVSSGVGVPEDVHV